MKRMGTRLGCAGVVVLMVSAPFWAAAQDSGLTPREQELLKTVQELQKRVGDLEQQVQALMPAKPAPPPPAEEQAVKAATPAEGRAPAAKPETEKKTPLQASWKDGLRLESADGDFKIQIGGRLSLDWVWFSQDAELKHSLGNEQDGVQIRTGRLRLEGTLFKDFLYRLEYDLSGNNGPNGFLDAYVGMKNIPYAGTLTIGHFKEPFGLEQLTLDYMTTFMERSLADVFTPARNTGIMLSNAFLGKPAKERLTAAVGIFKKTDNWPSVNDSDEREAYAVTARVTGLPWYRDDGRGLLHLGMAYSHREPNGSTIAPFRLQPWSETRMTKFTWLSSEGVGPLAAAPWRLQDARVNTVDEYGFEAALVYGPFSLQGEYMLCDVATALDGDRTFDGYYVQASYFLTGESRPYKNAPGIFDRVRPKQNFAWGKSPGAWELALRYSYLNLNDGAIRGGKEDSFTAGVNWYLNPSIRLMWNYTLANIDHDLYDGVMNIFQTRFQVDF